MLNSHQILEENLLKLNTEFGKPAQVGYDLSIKNVQKVGDNINPVIGKILKDKTVLTKYSEYDTVNLEGNEGWIFYPGVYDIVFNEGCKIGADRTAFVKQRSSLYRNGAIINSPLFDPGFETENMGSLMYVFLPIFIEKDARVAQIYFHESTPTTNLYNGQFMFDKQRIS